VDWEQRGKKALQATASWPVSSTRNSRLGNGQVTGYSHTGRQQKGVQKAPG
jgi:hypothetical protein